MAYIPGQPSFWYYSSPVQLTSSGEPMANQYAMSSAGFMGGLTIDCNQPTYISHSPSMNYNSPTHIAVYPESHRNLSPISPLTPLSAASMSPPPSEYTIAPNVCSKVPENLCPYEDCNSTGKFKRKTDLLRHIKTQHQANQNKTDCKHTWCGRTGDNGFSRLDHYREHLREVHREDIPYKTRRESSSRVLTKQKNRTRSSPTSAPRQMPFPVLPTQHH